MCLVGVYMICIERVLCYCPVNYKQIENYEKAIADTETMWVCHHRNGEEFSVEWLKANNMYYNRTDPHEFIFLTPNEHKKRHMKITFSGKKLSSDRKSKISNTLKAKGIKPPSRKGCAGPNKGKTLSKETKTKISNSLKKYYEGR